MGTGVSQDLNVLLMVPLGAGDTWMTVGMAYLDRAQE